MARYFNIEDPKVLKGQKGGVDIVDIQEIDIYDPKKGIVGVIYSETPDINSNKAYIGENINYKQDYCVDDKIPDNFFDEKHLKILTFNVHNFVKVCKSPGRNINHFKNFMQDNSTKYDIVCLQEIVPTNDSFVDLVNIMNGFGYTNYMITNQTYDTKDPAIKNAYYILANGIFIKDGITIESKKSYGLFGNRCLQKITVNYHNKTIDIYNIHFEFNISNKLRTQITQVTQILSESKNPFIICGDFNNKIDDPIFTKLLDIASVIKEYPRNDKVKFTGFNRKALIDYILTSKNIYNNNSKSFILRTQISDHYAVIGSIDIGVEKKELEIVTVEYSDEEEEEPKPVVPVVPVLPVSHVAPVVPIFPVAPITVGYSDEEEKGPDMVTAQIIFKKEPPPEPKDLVVDHLLPTGWQKYKNEFFNLATGEKAKERPAFGFGGVMERIGFPSLHDIIRLVETFNTTLFGELISFIGEKENYIIEAFSKEHVEWENENGKEEIIPWSILEQMELYIWIAKKFWNNHKRSLFNKENWALLVKQAYDYAPEIEIYITGIKEEKMEKMSTAEKIMVYLLSEDKGKSLILNIIKDIIKIFDLTDYIPDNCRFAFETMSMVAPFDRDIHVTSVNRDKINKEYCRIIFPAIISRGNSELIIKPRVIR